MSSLFSKPKTVAPQVAGFSSPGLSANFNGNSYNITQSPELTANLAGLSAAGGSAANTFQDLYGTVAPGFNDLLRSRLNTFNDAARSAIGDLSQNLASRRVLGSSFGQDTITRGNAEFARQRDAIVADNFLKSLAAQEQLTQDTLNARTTQFQTGINQSNIQAQLAAQLSGQGTQAMNQAAALNAQLQSNYQLGMGKLLGTGLGLLAAPFTGGTSLLGAGLTGLGNFGNTLANQFQWGTNSFLSNQPSNI